jgi:hypothetical protein
MCMRGALQTPLTPMHLGIFHNNKYNQISRIMLIQLNSFKQKSYLSFGEEKLYGVLTFLKIFRKNLLW